VFQAVFLLQRGVQRRLFKHGVRRVAPPHCRHRRCCNLGPQIPATATAIRLHQAGCSDAGLRAQVRHHAGHSSSRRKGLCLAHSRCRAGGESRVGRDEAWGEVPDRDERQPPRLQEGAG